MRVLLYVIGAILLGPQLLSATTYEQVAVWDGSTYQYVNGLSSTEPTDPGTVRMIFSSVEASADGSYILAGRHTTGLDPWQTSEVLWHNDMLTDLLLPEDMSGQEVNSQGTVLISKHWYTNGYAQTWPYLYSNGAIDPMTFPAPFKPVDFTKRLLNDAGTVAIQAQIYPGYGRENVGRVLVGDGSQWEDLPLPKITEGALNSLSLYDLWQDGSIIVHYSYSYSDGSYGGGGWYRWKNGSYQGLPNDPRPFTGDPQVDYFSLTGFLEGGEMIGTMGQGQNRYYAMYDGTTLLPLALCPAGVSCDITGMTPDGTFLLSERNTELVETHWVTTWSNYILKDGEFQYLPAPEGFETFQALQLLNGGKVLGILQNPSRMFFTPEPGSFCLLISALGGALFARRKASKG